MEKTVWNCRNIKDDDVNRLIKSAGIPRAIAQVLTARGITEESYPSFIAPQLSGLSDPFLLPGISDAAERIWHAIANGENILIFGDYDTDGVTSTAILIKTLSENGAKVDYFLPHRFEDGYGFSVDSLEKITETFNPSLIITVDCGINGVETTEAATEKGIDIIITDHHEPAEELPKALAVINPKLHNNINGLNVLAGVGVAFKLCHGFIKYGRQHGLGGNSTDLKKILDLVALGTVADIVPLLGENRVLVNTGLKVLATQVRPGIRALCEATKIQDTITPTHIAFNLAPRLNAAGRFGSPNEALNLLKTDNIIEAYKIAEELDSYNILRKDKENEIYEEAITQIETNKSDEGLQGAALVAGKDWHQGVIGIVASRLARDYFRPSIVLSIEGDIASGSGRSIGNISLIDLLNDTSEYLLQYGGHPLAAGLSLETSKIPEFFNAFNRTLKKYATPEFFVPTIDFDGLVELDALDRDFFMHLKKLEPFGCGNREPLFRINRLTPQHTARAAEKHTRGTLIDQNNNAIKFIAFNQDITTLPTSEYWDVLATPQINVYRGIESHQLQIIDFRSSENI